MSQLYKAIHRMHSARFIFALFCLSVCLVCLVASILSTVWLGVMATIWLLLASTFWSVVCIVEYRACDEYLAKYLASKIEEQKYHNYKN